MLVDTISTLARVCCALVDVLLAVRASEAFLALARVRVEHRDAVAAVVARIVGAVVTFVAVPT